MGPRAGLTGAENFVPTRIRSPDRPARSKSLYRMSYPGPYFILKRERLVRHAVWVYLDGADFHLFSSVSCCKGA